MKKKEFDLVIRSLHDRRFEDALAAINAVISRNPEDARAYLVRSAIHQATGELMDGFEDWQEAVRLDPSLTNIEPYKVEDCTFDQRPLADLPQNVDGDDQWTVTDENGVVQAAVVFGNEFTIWQDHSLTDAEKRDAVEEYSDTMARNEYEAAACELLAKWE